MASDGGPLFPFIVTDMSKTQVHEPGASVRDGFAMVAVTIGNHPEDTTKEKAASSIYDFAQALTDEKLRRDQADRDEGKHDGK